MLQNFRFGKLMHNKEKILLAAYELFFRYGIKSVTMDDIAKHLSISKKTIYQFFADKDEIVHELFDQYLQKHRKEFDVIASSSKNVVEEVFGYMKKMHFILGQINPSIFYDLRKYHVKTWDLFRKFRTEYLIVVVEKTIDKGKRDGFVRTDIKTKVIARMRAEQIDMGFNPTVFPTDKFNILEVQLAMTEHFLYGICTIKGHKLINKNKQLIKAE